MPKSTDPVVVLVRPADSACLAIARQLASAGQVRASDFAARRDLGQQTLSQCLRDRRSGNHATGLL